MNASLLPLFSALALFSGAFMIAPRLQETAKEKHRLSEIWGSQPIQTELEASRARAFASLVSLGHLNSFVDYLLVRFLTEDDSIQHVKVGAHPVGFFTLDLATSVDPAFYSLYLSGASYVAVVRNDGVGAAHLLEKGERFRREELSTYPERFRTRFWENDWNIPALLGYTYLFELKDMPRAAEAFRRAGEHPAAPEFLRSLADRLSQPYGPYEVAIRLTSFWIRGAAEDPPRLNALKNRLRSLEVQYFLKRLNNEWTSLRAASSRKRTEFASRYAGAEDPWGGTLALKGDRWVSSTPYEPQMGLD